MISPAICGGTGDQGGRGADVRLALGADALHVGDAAATRGHRAGRLVVDLAAWPCRPCSPPHRTRTNPGLRPPAAAALAALPLGPGAVDLEALVLQGAGGPGQRVRTLREQVLLAAGLAVHERKGVGQRVARRALGDRPHQLGELAEVVGHEDELADLHAVAVTTRVPADGTDVDVAALAEGEGGRGPGGRDGSRRWRPRPPPWCPCGRCGNGGKRKCACWAPSSRDDCRTDHLIAQEMTWIFARVRRDTTKRQEIP